ncbi:MAG: nickel pincer cofactor biosynthesis protein LarC [Firmicutes bacterium]|nr:nickel pincer cofactor biosynthesis protein LarC [Bacillota bacterium]
MKTLYLDCSMGAAGDMLTAALLELFEDKDNTLAKLNALAIPGVEYRYEKISRQGIAGTLMHVRVNGEEEDECEHHHDDHEHHHHASMADIEAIIDGTKASDKVKTDAKNIYKLIAAAESKAHDMEVTEIHFHEVGAMDAVADVTACCYLMEKLGAERVVASPVHVGKGTVRCAHGVLPVPAPATANILLGVPTYSADIDSELCTPTGAAVLKYFVNEFRDQPVMKAEAIGYGMGRKDFPRLNAVRAIIGTEEGNTEHIVELSLNLDDMTPEKIGFACDRFFELGAVEVYTTPIYMKKSRPGVLLTVMVKESLRDSMVEAIFKYTTTLGIRENVSKRYALKREVVPVETPFGEIREKRSSGYGVTRSKYEYDDLAAIAHGEGISIDEVIRALEQHEGTHIEKEEEDF